MPPRAVALVIGQLHLGGAERQLYELAVRLDPARWRPSVVCLSEATEPYAQRLRARGVPVDVVPRSGHNDLGRAAALAGLLRARGASLAHAFLLAANAYTWAACRLIAPLRGGRRLPYIASTRVCSPLPGWAATLVHRRAFRSAVGVVANSSRVMDHTRALYRLSGVRVRVIPNGLSLQEYPERDGEQARAARSAARGELDAPEGTLLIGTLGRLAPQKNVGLFLEMAARIARRAAPGDRRFVVAGDGTLGDALRRRAGELGLEGRVVFTGPREDVPRLMGALDLFVLTSDYEGLPNAVMEAMASGLAVVATRTGGTEELVQEGLTGHLVPARDLEALTDRVARLAEDAGRREAMGRRGRAAIESGFTVEAMVARTAALYEEALG